jgi:hypothetical protein
VEDTGFSDGARDRTAANLEVDAARQIAKGASVIAMYLRDFNTSAWEPGTFEKLSTWLRTQRLHEQAHHPILTIALYQPTWGTSALPARDAVHKFAPKWEYTLFLTKMIGLVESFGLPYRLITEADLMDRSRLKGFTHIIVPIWDYIPRIVGPSAYRSLEKDPRIVGIPAANRSLTRTEFRKILNNAAIPSQLDYDSDYSYVGRYGNMLYNRHNRAVTVKIPERNSDITLQPYQYLITN